MRHVERMPAKRFDVVPLVRSRRGRGQVGDGFFLAASILLGCAAAHRGPATPAAAARPVAIGSSCASSPARPPGPPQRIAFGMYSADPRDFDALAQDGLTTVGPWYVPAPDRAVLDRAAAAGLGVVYPLGDPQGRANGVFAHTEAQTRARVGAAVRAVVDHPAVVAWYLLPEELRAWDPAELAYLRVATETIRAADPLRRPILSYQPNHHDAAALAPVAAHFDIATKGMYANYAGHRDARVWVRWSVDELEAASDAPVWVVPEMFEDPPGADAAAIEGWVRHDVYAGLVAGARGVLVYSGFRRAGFSRFDDYLAAYRTVARELNGPLGLGDVLVRGTSCDVGAAEVVAGPSEVTFEVGDALRRAPSLGQLLLAHDGARWMWLVNSSPQPLTARVHGWSDAIVVAPTPRLRRDGDDVHLPAWGVAVLRMP